MGIAVCKILESYDDFLEEYIKGKNNIKIMRKETNKKFYAKDLIRLCRKEELEITPEGEKFFKEVLKSLGLDK